LSANHSITQKLTHLQTDNYDGDIIDPALNVTRSILDAASRTPSIKRVVITSSAVTLIPFAFMFGAPNSPPDLTLFTPEHVNLNLSKPYGSSMEAYFASKTLSRIATHDFMAYHKPHFEYVNLLPTLVFGPDELATNVTELMTSSRGLALGLLTGDNFLSSEMVGASVHVDDVARAHIDALKPSVPGNKDYILSSDAPEGLVWEDRKAMARREFPEAVEMGVLVLEGEMGTKKWRLDVSETEKAFGWKFIGFEETYKELVEQYLRYVETEKS
jgi:nucleoside-diphosphate-sugar epimerase